MTDDPLTTPVEEYEHADDEAEAEDIVHADDDREDDADEETDDEIEENGDEVDETNSDVVPVEEPPTPPTGGLALRTLNLQNFQLGPTGLRVTGEPTLDDWAGIGELLRTFEHGLQWAIGDWINAGEGRFGDKAAQVLGHTAWSVRTTAIYRWAASRVPPENRRVDLTFSHHLVVADMSPQEQRAWLEKAAASGEATGETWSVQRLKREMAVATAKGTSLRYLLVVDCDDEGKREKLQKKLERDGFLCRCAEATRKRALKAGKAVRGDVKQVVRGRKAGARGGRKRRRV